MLNEADLVKARKWIQAAKRVAVLTGAGVSAESGVPTFRDAQTGHWAKHRAEDMATEAGFRAEPSMVYAWYEHRRAMVSQVSPNAGHVALAQWAKRHPNLMHLATQNVDGLHQMAGSPQVNALHGELMHDKWLNRERPCCREALFAKRQLGMPMGAGRNWVPTVPPKCPVCGNLRRPAVVWFGEQLPPGAFEAASEAAQQCDVLLVAGTAGAVYPAAGLAALARSHGAKVVLVNPNPSEIDDEAHVVLRGASAHVLPRLLADD